VSAITRDLTPAELRQGQARRLALRLGLDGDALYDAAVAAWDNLGCQQHTFDQALSVAGAALRAAAERQDKHDAAASRAARRQPQPPSPAVFGFSDEVGLGRLDVGVIAERELSRSGQVLHETVVPCCGRPVTLRLEDKRDTTRVACCRCRVLYEAGLRDEDDDPPSFVARFEVTALGVAAASHRDRKRQS
jgi:hypothetical protein